MCTLYTGKNITQSTPPLLLYAVLLFVTIFKKEKREKGTTQKCSKALMPFTAVSAAWQAQHHSSERMKEMRLSTDPTSEPHTVCGSISHAGSKVNSSKGKFFHYLELCKECKTPDWILLVSGPLGCVTQRQKRILTLYANSPLITSHKSELLEKVALGSIRPRIIWE